MFKYKDDKNKLLQKERNISFEEIIKAIMNGQVWRAYPNPNPEYENQVLYDVVIDNYVYTVATFHENEMIHLITVFPNRKARKKWASENAEKRKKGG